MKKFLKTGKKTLSVIMAIMMLMSAWVWVAPTEASAAEMGKYEVTIKFNLEDADAVGGHVVIWYYPLKSDNSGYDTSNTTAKHTVANSLAKAAAKDHEFTQTVPGFPWRLELKIDDSDLFDETYLDLKYFKIGDEVIVGSSIGDFQNAICYFDYNGAFHTYDENGKSIGTNAGRVDSVTGEGFTWDLPTPDGNSIIEYSDVADMTCPVSGKTQTQTVKVKVNDQYGVPMYNPKWSVKGSVCGTTGISVTSTTVAAESTVITLTNSANVAGTTHSQIGTIVADWGTGSLSDTFTINDTTYTAKFNYKTASGADTTVNKTGKHGATITAPTASEYDIGDYHYKFDKWSPTFNSTITNDVTYTAQYTSSFVAADYTAVNEAIAAANAIKANYGTEYELKYTLASRVALDNAIDAVVTGLGRTRQSEVDGYAAEINAKIAALDPNKFDVIFLDNNGAILLYEKNVEYKQSVEVPSFPKEQKKYHDATNHYTYSGWDTNEYTSVIDDLVISPVYVAEAHDFVSESVSSTCVQAGTTKHTCQTCGYTYYDGGEELGDHVWEADFTVDLEPTCVLAGSKSIHCTLCDAQKDITAIEPKGHTWESYTVAVNPTCTNIGISTRVCAEPDCRFCEHLVIDPINHNYEKTTVAPTCTAKGYDEYVCQNDGCGHSYRDNFKDTVAHTYGAWETVSEAHCGVAGVKKQTCTVENCGHVNIGSIDALEHDALDSLSWNVIVAPTCETKGYQVKNCSKCNNVIASEDIPALTHEYKAEVVKPTCTTKGYTKKTCQRKNCGDVIYTDETPALNHAWISTTHAATCTSSAYIEHVCSNDSAHNYIEYVAGSTVEPHTWEKTDEKAADCENNGFIKYECSVCKDTKEEILPRLGHAYPNTWTVEKEATNSEDGKWTRTCANCKNAETITIPKGGHNFVEDEKQYVAPTCNTKGQRVYKCDAHENCIAAVTVVLDYTQHEIAQKVENATCKANGSVKAYCSVCDKNCENPFSTTETPVVPHTLNSGVATEATCTTSGYTTYTCTANDCDFSYKLYDESKPATGHKYNAVVTTAATCEGVGLMTYTCACGDSYTADIPAKGHAYGNWQKTDATNTEDGQWKRVCGNDENHIETVVIPKGGHEWDDGKETLAPTCTTDGKMLYACKNHTGENACGITFETTIPATGHSYEAKETLAPGCTTKGEITYTCACNHSYTETIPAKGHDLTTTVNDAKCGEKGSVVITCSRCDDLAAEKTIELAAKGHIWGATPTKTEKATCEADGSKTYKCENCNETNVVVIPKLGHEWGNWRVTKDSTNTEKGTLTRTCTRGCTETAEIPAGNHKLVVDNEKSIPASCKTEGTTVYKCENHTDCGIALSVTEPMLQHAVAQREIEASCKTEGKVEAYCTVCNDVLSTEIIPVKAHNFVAHTPAVEPTCTTSGYTVYKCTCGDTYNVYDESKPAKGHTLVEGASTANCTTGGIKTLSCSVCKNYTVNVNVPALGHNYVENTLAATEATCASPATKTYKCSRCTDSYTVFEGEKTTNHSWGNEKIVEVATATSLGYKTFECSVCGQIKAETIPATGDHKFSVETDDKKAPTCTEDGYIVYACATNHGCGLTSKVTVPATGHKEALNYKAATCGEAGYAKIVCSVESCKAVLSEETIPALGHLYGEGTVTNATCKDEGKIVYTCTRENCTDKTKTVTIPENEKAHQYATTVTPATCKAEGSVVTKCALCDVVTTNEKLSMINHTWNDGEIKEGDAATCIKDGTKTYTCTVTDCGATKTETIAKLGHAWGEWTVTKASTNTEKGTLIRTCSRGCTETADIPAGGHNLVISSETEATCAAPGSVTYTCDTAHEGGVACGITVTVKLDMLQHELVTTKKDATCTENGEVVTKCKNCDTTTITTIIPATKHNYEGVVTTEATCTATGTKTYTCSKCKDSYTETLPKLQHEYAEESTTAPTCTASGYITYKCNTCDSSYVVITSPAKGHSFTEKVSSTASCTAEGILTLKCAGCDKTMTTEVPALAHEFKKQGENSPATCVKPTTAVYKCECGETYTAVIDSALADHDWGEWVTVKAATNTSLGYKTKTCKVCGDVDYEIISATGEHKFDKETDRKNATCTEEGYVIYGCSYHNNCSETSKVTLPKLGHTEKISYKAATCTDEGYAKIVCAVDGCDYEADVTTIPALGHLFDGEGTYVDATCKTEGSMTYTCGRANCDEKHITAIAVNPDAHKLKRDVVDATCKTAGSITVTCENGCTYNETTTLPMLQHDLTDWVKRDSTNSHEGHWYHKCTKCDFEETLTIPAGGHSFDTTNPASTTAATCKTQGTATYNCSAHTDCGVTITVDTGYAEHTYAIKKVESCSVNGSVITYCTVCENELSRIDLGMAQHKYVASAPVLATCTKSGYTTYTCECGATYDEIDGDALGHDLVITPAGATCTQSGTVVVTCSRCNFRQETNDTALGHNYQKISSTKATCAAAATETYECTRCSASYTVSVGEKATEHSYPDAWTVVKEATPVSIGYKTRECTVCGKLEVQTINATGEHVFEGGDVVESKPATCTENGYEIRKCKAHTDCGETTEITLFATGHDEIVTTTAASCEGEGSIVTTCSKCTYKNTETIPALGHVWGDEKVTPATCKAEGSVEYTCARDNCGEKRIVVIGIDKDAHKYKTTVNQASCTDDGSVITECTLCGNTTTVIIPAKGHTFTGAETTVKDATCTENGEKTVKCANCNVTETVIIPKLGHKMVAGKAVAPTCTSSGYTPYTCENGCGENYKVYDSTVVKHNYVKVENSSTATCLDGGTITMKCSLCSDEIKAAVPALGHSYGNWTTVNPTAEADGSKTRECGRCHVTETVILPKLGHNMVKDAAASVAPTCTEEGTDVYVCNSHKDDEACGYTYTVKVPAKGHSYGVGEETTKVSCDTDGVITYKCTTDGCSNAITEIVPKKGHNLSTKVNEATCEAEGSAVTTCSRCNFNITEKLAIKPHTLSLSTAYPGCEKEGYATTWCSVCKKEIHRETLAALGHSFTGEETVTKNATCLEKGEKTVKCSRCDKTTTAEIPATGHNYVAGEEVKATCTESGYIPYTCKNKDCTSSYRDLTSNPNGHKWNTTAVSETKATCEKDGVAVYKCQFCEATNEVVTPKFGHSWTEWTVSKAPTADEDGEKTRTCLRGCKETVSIPAIGGVTTYKVDFVLDGEIIFTQTVTHLGSATAPVVANKESDDNYHYILGWDKDFSRVSSDLTVNAVFTPVKHSFGEWVTDKTADCKNTGLRHRVCDCGYVDEEVIAKTEHSFSEIKEEKAATCTNSGYKVLVCKNCGDTETKTINKLGHSMTYHQGYDATCDTDGVARHYSCSRCGKSFEDRAGSKELSSTVITRKYHIFIVVPGTAPTCDTDGIMDYRYCTTCGYTQHPDSIPATGHVDANRDNTCDKCGATYMQGGNIVCKCSCHKNGFINEFIYKILSFFWRLFGTNKSCECGKVHY